MKRNLSIIFGMIFLFILFSLSLFPVSIQAQPNSQGGPLYINKNTPSVNLDSASFDWHWLLPLLAIPIIFYIWQVIYSNEHDENRTSKINNQTLTGIKGGSKSSKTHRPTRISRHRK